MNPYETPESNATSPVVAKRAVRRYYVLAVCLGWIAVLAGTPGCYLLNQEWQVIPTSTFVGGFEAGGNSIPTTNVRWFSLAVGGSLLLCSVSSATVGYANARRNRSE